MIQGIVYAIVGFIIAASAIGLLLFITAIILAVKDENEE